mmetsp:Transcript_32037/g.70182  ORF Transcript_32037/g.70182 Transcript_32037/m.70182 type:complete len:298 (-) Transcript_32037:191-1084(-)
MFEWISRSTRILASLYISPPNSANVCPLNSSLNCERTWSANSTFSSATACCLISCRSWAMTTGANSRRNPNFCPSVMKPLLSRTGLEARSVARTPAVTGVRGVGAMGGSNSDSLQLLSKVSLVDDVSLDMDSAVAVSQGIDSRVVVLAMGVLLRLLSNASQPSVEVPEPLRCRRRYRCLPSLASGAFPPSTLAKGKGLGTLRPPTGEAAKLRFPTRSTWASGVAGSSSPTNCASSWIPKHCFGDSAGTETLGGPPLALMKGTLRPVSGGGVVARALTGLRRAVRGIAHGTRSSTSGV